VHKGKNKSVELSDEQVRLMQTQDKRYITSRRVMELKKVEKLNASLQRLEEAPVNKHKFFTEDEKEFKKFRLAKHLDTPAELIGRKYNRIRNSDLAKIDLTKVVKDVETLKNCEKLASKRYKELMRRTERKDKLATLEEKMRIKQVLQVCEISYLNYTLS